MRLVRSFLHLPQAKLCRLYPRLVFCLVLIAGYQATAQINSGGAPPEASPSGVPHPGSRVRSLQLGIHSDDTLTYTVELEVKKLLTDFLAVDEDCDEITPGSWNVDTEPAHGVVDSALISGTLLNGECPGMEFTAAAIYYTWTDENTDETTDTFQATWSGDGYTEPETFVLNLESSCDSSQEPGVQDAAACSLTLKRLSLMQVQATATANGGTFKNSVKAQTGSNNVLVAFASGNTETSNPNVAQLSDPGNPKSAPSPGGLAQVTVKYTKSGASLSDSYKVPTFGMSCYYTTLQSDWGVAPNHCKFLKINGKKYSGTVKNPPGLTGTYCSSFLADVRFGQGSGELNSGQDIQYLGGTYKKVSAIHGKDGSVVVANKTLARSKTIIPDKGVKLDVDQIGTSLLANDIGPKIVGYRLDYYRGVGESVCSGFSNIMSVSACTPAQTACPASAVK